MIDRHSEGCDVFVNRDAIDGASVFDVEIWECAVDVKADFLASLCCAEDANHWDLREIPLRQQGGVTP